MFPTIYTVKQGILSGLFTKDCFGHDRTRSFIWLIGRIFKKLVGNLRAVPYTFGGRSGAIASVLRPSTGYRKSENMLKTVPDQKLLSRGRRRVP